MRTLAECECLLIRRHCHFIVSTGGRGCGGQAREVFSVEEAQLSSRVSIARQHAQRVRGAVIDLPARREGGGEWWGMRARTRDWKKYSGVPPKGPLVGMAGVVVHGFETLPIPSLPALYMRPPPAQAQAYRQACPAAAHAIMSASDR